MVTATAMAMVEVKNEILRIIDEMVRIIDSELSSFHGSVELFDEAIAMDELYNVLRRDKP